MRYLLILFFWLPLLLNAEIVWRAEVDKPFAVTIKLNSEEIPLDGLIDFEAEFRYPAGYELNIDSLLDQLIWSANPLDPQLSLIQSSISIISESEEIPGQRLHATISPLVVGTIDLSLFTITFFPKESSQPPLSVLTPVFHLHILPLAAHPSLPPLSPLIALEPQFPIGLTQSNQFLLRDNPKIIEEEKRTIQQELELHSFPWLSMITLLGFGGIGWAAYLMRDRWPKHKPKPSPPQSPKQQAIGALDALQKGNLLEQGFMRTYYEELSTILLTALQEGYLGGKGLEMTTFEFEKALHNVSMLSEKQKQEILSIMTEIDKVKYSGEKPPLDKAKELYHRIRDFVNEDFQHL